MDKDRYNEIIDRILKTILEYEEAGNYRGLCTITAKMESRKILNYLESYALLQTMEDLKPYGRVRKLFWWDFKEYKITLWPPKITIISTAFPKDYSKWYVPRKRFVKKLRKHYSKFIKHYEQKLNHLQETE